MRAAPDVARRLDAGHARHVHVEKADIGPLGIEQLDRLSAVSRLRDDLEFRPGLRELERERLAEQRLVVGDQGRRLRAHQAVACCAGKSNSAVTPRGR